jgi:hypothetical protein
MTISPYAVSAYQKLPKSKDVIISSIVRLYTKTCEMYSKQKPVIMGFMGG